MCQWRVLKWAEKKYSYHDIDSRECKGCDFYYSVMLDGDDSYQNRLDGHCIDLERIRYFNPKEIWWNLQNGEVTLIGDDGYESHEYPSGCKPIFRCLLSRAETCMESRAAEQT